MSIGLKANTIDCLSENVSILLKNSPLSSPSPRPGRKEVIIMVAGAAAARVEIKQLINTTHHPP